MAPDVFFRNRGDGTFEEATAAAGLVDTTGKGLGVVAADLTGDGWPDVYVANDSTPNFLFRNRGDGTFQEAGLLLGVGYNEEGLTEAGMGTAVGDVDGDGYLDLFVTNLSAETNALYLGGPQFFTYQTRQAGLFSGSYLPVGFGAELDDLDNDGDLDLLVTNGHVIDNIELIDDAQSFRQPSQLFWNDGAGRFTEADPKALGDLARAAGRPRHHLARRRQRRPARRAHHLQQRSGAAVPQRAAHGGRLDRPRSRRPRRRRRRPGDGGVGRPVAAGGTRHRVELPDQRRPAAAARPRRREPGRAGHGPLVGR